MRKSALLRIWLVALALCGFLSASRSGAESPAPLLQGMTGDEIMRLGEAMYRTGILPSGEPLQAIVEGDIQVEGTMFTCSHCHMRSGIGSNEGTVITPPTNGASLFIPRKPGPRYTRKQEEMRPEPFRVPEDRPAYTDETLGRVLTDGVDPAGKTLDYIMPRYLLEPRDRAILVQYLKNLSADPSPGASDTTIDFATVIAGNVSQADRDAMLAPLQAYIKSRNSRAPYYQARARLPIPEEMNLSHRKLSLSVWELKGSRETWRSQLEQHYREQPVFAVVGGIADGDWRPIHEFCEQNRIPCIMPVTDKPVVSEGDWYTIYFSKGSYQEGEFAARFVRNRTEDGLAGGANIVNIYRENSRGAELARGFLDVWRETGRPLPAEMVLTGDTPPPSDLLVSLSSKPGLVAALWLDARDLEHIQFPEKPVSEIMVLVSAGMLKERFSAVPDHARTYTYLTYPFRLPKDRRQIDLVVKSWLKSQRIPVTNLSISSDMYALGTVLTDALMHMKRNYYRDHFLDVIDMLPDRTHTVRNYPRWSFGPGQRSVSKGCYIVQLTPGPEPELIPRSEWVLH